jgi:hypothetical protein
MAFIYNPRNASNCLAEIRDTRRCFWIPLYGPRYYCNNLVTDSIPWFYLTKTFRQMYTHISQLAVPFFFFWMINEHPNFVCFSFFFMHIPDENYKIYFYFFVSKQHWSIKKH